MERLALCFSEEPDRRSSELSEQLGERLAALKRLDAPKTVVSGYLELRRDQCTAAGCVHGLERPGGELRALRRREEKASDRVSEAPNLRDMRDGKGTVAQPTLFCLQPTAEVRRVGEQVDRLAFPHHHHRVREIDREHLPQPAEDWAAAPRWTEPFDLTGHA